MIETYNESSLHKALKDYFTPKDAKQEVLLKGSVCDILCENTKIYEIQTANISRLRTKLEKFLPEYKIEVVYPIIENNFIRMLNSDTSERSYRKSPKHGEFFQIFREITGIYYLIGHKNLTLNLLYIDAETIKIDDGLGRSRRKRPRIIDKKLIKINRSQKIKNIEELIMPVKVRLRPSFLMKDVRVSCSKKYANYIVWFLRKLEIIKLTEKRGNAHVYEFC
ncbi:MAG: hypothetical protein CR988_02560 [Treponema sp.]|nr:MAG: hypothetical protein CR988_02560 [Treponema sp.]